MPIMRTDALFYSIFQQFPQLFFELIGRDYSDAQNYQFVTEELKEISLTLDGLLIPQADYEHNPLYFIEVQFQKKQNFYPRLFAEIFTYLYQKEVTLPWQAVVIFPTKNIEVEPSGAYQELMESNRVIHIYIDEIINNFQQNSELDLFRLFQSPLEETKTIAKNLIKREYAWLGDESKQKNWVRLIETIIVYKYPKLTRKEIEMLFGLAELKDTKVYQEAFQEGQIEGYQQGMQQGMQQGLQQGMQQGMQQEIIKTIELGLELKFGSAGNRLLPEIMLIKDVGLLNRIRASIKGAENINEIRLIYA